MVIKCFISVFKKLKNLDHTLLITTQGGYKATSAANIKSQINRYLDFCIGYLLPPVPVTDLQIRRYSQHRADKISFNSIQNYTVE